MMAKYAAVFQLQLRATRVYRLNWVFSILCVIVPLLGLLLFWRAVYSASPGSQLRGYTIRDMMTYYLIARLVGDAVSAEWWEIGQNIRDGKLHLFVIRPIGYVGYYFARMLGTNVPSLIVTLGMFTPIIVGLAALDMLSVASGWSLLLFVPSLIAAVVLGFLIGMASQLTAFWTGEMQGMESLRRVLTGVLMGAYFPLDLLGPGLRSIASYLPFYYQLYFPTELLIGKRTMPQVGLGLAIQALWIVLLVLLVRTLWSRGMRRYQSVGG